MKKLLFVFVMVALNQVAAQNKINWMSMNEALAAQKESPKKIIMDVYTKWCGPCKMLDRNTFSNKDVIKSINENYYAVKFDAEGIEEVTYNDYTYANPDYIEGRRGRNSTHLFTRFIKVNGYPSLVFFKDNGEIINAVPGYKTAKQLEIYLKMIANDDYLTLNTGEAWQEYQKNFKGTF